MLIEFVSKTADGRTAPLGAKRRGEGGKEYPALFISLLLAALSFSFSTSNSVGTNPTAPGETRDM